MSKTNLKFVDISIKKLTFHCSEYPIDMDKVIIE